MFKGTDTEETLGFIVIFFINGVISIEGGVGFLLCLQIESDVVK